MFSVRGGGKFPWYGRWGSCDSAMCKGLTPKWGAAGSRGSFGRCLRVSGAPKDPMRSLRTAWEPSRDPSKDPAGAFAVFLTRRRRSAAYCCSVWSWVCCPDGRRQRSYCVKSFTPFARGGVQVGSAAGKPSAAPERAQLCQLCWFLRSTLLHRCRDATQR